MVVREEKYIVSLWDMLLQINLNRTIVGASEACIALMLPSFYVKLTNYPELCHHFCFLTTQNTCRYAWKKVLRIHLWCITCTCLESWCTQRIWSNKRPWQRQASFYPSSGYSSEVVHSDTPKRGRIIRTLTFRL